MNPTEEPAQESLFDLSGKEYNAYWVDEKQPLFIPNNPLHWKAHKLQVLISRLEIQSQKNPAQFNSKNYIETLNEFENLMNKIRKALDDDELDPADMVGSRDTETAPQVGPGATSSVDLGVSADNPLAR